MVWPVLRGDTHPCAATGGAARQEPIRQEAVVPQPSDKYASIRLACHQPASESIRKARIWKFDFCLASWNANALRVTESGMELCGMVASLQ